MLYYINFSNEIGFAVRPNLSSYIFAINSKALIAKIKQAKIKFETDIS